MKIEGIAASPGISIGRAYLVSEESYCVIKRNIGESQIKKEISRFKKAIDRTDIEFRRQRDRVVREMGRIYARLFDAYILILKDPLLYRETIKIINDEKVNVEYALQSVIDNITKTFSMLDDEYMRDRIKDVQDVGNRVMRDLLGYENVSLKEIQNRVALVAHALHPSDAVEIKKENVIGFVTDVGGKTSHIVIMAESLEIPAVVGLKRITQVVSPGDLLIIDGYNGTVYVNPTPEVIRDYRRQKRIRESTRRKLIELKGTPTVTKCGEKIDLAVNIEEPGESLAVKEYGASGVGLFRSEYLYLRRTHLPTEDEMYRNFKEVAESIHPNPLIIRTVDLGADKLSTQLRIKSEKESLMGMRGIRLCLAYPGMFKTQLKAILRASQGGNILIKYPMVTTIKEIISANHILREVKEELDSEGIAFDRNLKVGVMIETPAAALGVDNIAKEVDFLSIGTNDLIQYTLAVDRISETVSYLYNPADISILKLIQRIIEGSERNKKWVSMCGETAADTLYTELLLGMGLRRFSMTGIAIPSVKQIIMNTKIARCEELASRVLNLHETSKILNLLKTSKEEILQP